MTIWRIAVSVIVVATRAARMMEEHSDTGRWLMLGQELIDRAPGGRSLGGRSHLAAAFQARRRWRPGHRAPPRGWPRLREVHATRIRATPVPGISLPVETNPRFQPGRKHGLEVPGVQRRVASGFAPRPRRSRTFVLHSEAWRPWQEWLSCTRYPPPLNCDPLPGISVRTNPDMVTSLAL